MTINGVKQHSGMTNLDVWVSIPKSIKVDIKKLDILLRGSYYRPVFHFADEKYKTVWVSINQMTMDRKRLKEIIEEVFEGSSDINLYVTQLNDSDFIDWNWISRK